MSRYVVRNPAGFYLVGHCQFVPDVRLAQSFPTAEEARRYKRACRLTPGQEKEFKVCEVTDGGLVLPAE
jgi:hypothetical protein